MKHSIVEMIRDYAENQPDRLCMADTKTELTYSDVWEKVKQKAAVLKRKGVARGNCVLAVCTQDTSFAVWGLAIQLVGSVFVPVEKGAGKASI